MELTERDFEVLRLVHKFRFCLARHIFVLAGFGGIRTTDRRLKALVDGQYLKRKKHLYGTPYLYTLAHKGRVLIGVNKREDRIRVERITHDINVIENAIYFIDKYRLSLKDIESEKELHINDGFGTRKHQPDFTFLHSDQKYAVEIELSIKAKNRLETNIRNNYLNYDGQIWICGDKKIFSLINDFNETYTNIELIFLEEVLENVRGKYR